MASESRRVCHLLERGQAHPHDNHQRRAHARGDSPAEEDTTTGPSTLRGGTSAAAYSHRPLQQAHGGGGRLVRPTHTVLPLRQENQTLDHKAAQVPHPTGPPERLHPLLWVYHCTTNLSHHKFLEVAGEALVNFRSEEWPSDGTYIDRAPDLPLEERADYERMGRPWRRRVGAPVVDSSDEEMVDEPEAPRSPLLMPPPADAPAAAPAPDPDAAPAAAPAAAPPVPGSPAAEDEGVMSRPTQSVIDPVGQLHRGDHTL